MNTLKFASFAFILFLAACTSPAEKMTALEVSTLSDRQLCELQRTYKWEKKTELEIGRRNLNCDPANIECMELGMRANTPEMAVCVRQMHEKAELQRQIDKQRQEIERQRAEHEKLIK